MKSKKEGRCLSAGEFARLLGKNPRTVRRWLSEAWRDKQFKVTRTKGGHYRIPRKVALSFIADQSHLNL
jgi:hypothetical protein